MKKLKAGTLQLVTFIMVVIALLLASFLILNHVHKQFRLQTFHTIEMIHLSNTGISHSLSQVDTIIDTLTIPLFDEAYKSLKIKTDFWGIYEKVYSQASIKQKTFSKIALIGKEQSQTKTALYLKDNNRPLVVVGHTKIKGQTYLPERGVKSGNISGHAYYGQTFLDGVTKTIQDFPKLSSDLRAHINSLAKQYTENQNDVMYFGLNTRKVVNSFKNKLLITYSLNDIELSEIHLSGYIIIQSNTKIIVDETSTLKDVILIAPVIEVKKNVNSTFQALATERIIVAENVKLNYPSALVLLNDNKKENYKTSHFLEIKSNSHIKGSVLCLGKTQKNNTDIQLKIDNNVLVEGEIYCQQNLELRGTVVGSVYTNNFIVKENGTTYQNHLYNGKINANLLTIQYVGLAFDDSSKNVMKWLY
ncbi:hypothetical protein [Psychroserpens damuponensis]|uniref:hypothetical protein n=1 Tax=Psychroserpens damuponensis TaxID=943936 RepID=UPI00058E91D1|nr:hypothetical protein [Psychroserpens damuponensis]